MSYEKDYAKSEINFSIPFTHNQLLVDELVLDLKTDTRDIEIEIYGAYFRKIDNSPQDVEIEINIEELQTTSSGGVEVTDILKANKDRYKSDVLSFTLLKDGVPPLVFDRVNSTNIFRSGGLAAKRVVSYSCNLNFKYRLKKNTSYLISSKVVLGNTNTSESLLYGKVRELWKNVVVR